MPGMTPVDFVPDTETMYQREDMRSVSIWMLKGSRPQWPETQGTWPLGLLLLMRACWAQAASNRPTFVQIVRVLDKLRQSLDGAVMQPPPEDKKAATARDWLSALGYLSDAQIDEAVAYTQEEGEPQALVDMDVEDFDEMVQEMKVSNVNPILFNVYQARLSHRGPCCFCGSWVTMRVSFEMQCVDSRKRKKQVWRLKSGEC